jgi:hypothetical protein
VGRRRNQEAAPGLLRGAYDAVIGAPRELAEGLLDTGDSLFGTGGKGVKRNPSKKPPSEAQLKARAAFTAMVKAKAAARRKAAQKGTKANPIRFSEAEARRYSGKIKGLSVAPAKRRTPAKRKTGGKKKGATKGLFRSYKTGRLFGRAVKKTGKGIKRGARAVGRGARASGRGFWHGLFNPDAHGVFTEFRGKEPTGIVTSRGHGPDGRVINVAEIGKLKEMTVTGYPKPLKFSGAARLVADSSKRLHVTGVRIKNKTNPGQPANCGPIESIVYYSDKPHIDKRKQEYIHNFGDEGGKRPHLYIDAEGYPVIRGGSYEIKSPGIIN